jgi:hypothetical protein
MQPSCQVRDVSAVISERAIEGCNEGQRDREECDRGCVLVPCKPTLLLPKQSVPAQSLLVGQACSLSLLAGRRHHPAPAHPGVKVTRTGYMWLEHSSTWDL